ncbi:MAG: adenine methylase, partial [Haloplasmataceae bacterium]|nr:adenine methylase [Haloplasmataceae bacterium]
DTSKYINYLSDIQNRLRSVVIENRDFEKIITTYDRESTLFYLDPPYYGTENYYKEVDFTIDDHERLKKALGNIKGKFILSYNDCPEIRELYKDYKIEAIKRKSNLTSRYSNADKEFSELVIVN